MLVGRSERAVGRPKFEPSRMEELAREVLDRYLERSVGGWKHHEATCGRGGSPPGSPGAFVDHGWSGDQLSLRRAGVGHRRSEGARRRRLSTRTPAAYGRALGAGGRERRLTEAPPRRRRRQEVRRRRPFAVGDRSRAHRPSGFPRGHRRVPNDRDDAVRDPREPRVHGRGASALASWLRSARRDRRARGGRGGRQVHPARRAIRGEGGRSPRPRARLRRSRGRSRLPRGPRHRTEGRRGLVAPRCAARTTRRRRQALAPRRPSPPIRRSGRAVRARRRADARQRRRDRRPRARRARATLVHRGHARSRRWLHRGQAPPDARRIVESLLRTAPNDVGSHVAAGHVALAEGRVDDAIKEGEAANKLMPNVAAAKLLVADGWAKKGEIDLALEAYQAAFSLDHPIRRRW